MAPYIVDYLNLGSVEEIDAALRKRGTDMTSPNAQAAGIACNVLAMRKVERTLERLDHAATRLQVASLVLSVVSLIVAVVGVLGAH